ncbi:alcohol dehydrogenase catalytic domain-containing protein [Corynebacterium sp. HMSC077G01]|uniref:alcohol dehydrogenase catalytic domain-containing protein n=1 Tax=Corynebacterium sp. HMSC077G01 TaxID=1715193 RepID=UPI0008A57D69|nr:alcohol dehydrogenase catalytic domain-containing protein [Corynebacterium sp. HMSC077G01]OFM16936.1 hypothetical protein HMPREF2714_09770 [Corynebacterium sp. HMSC077G01]
MHEVRIPELQDDQTLVELTTATICGSNRHSVLGREGVGTVLVIRNPNSQVGQRVVFTVTAPYMESDRCRNGMTGERRNLKTVTRFLMTAGHCTYINKQLT